jgi:hypothetical protein
MAVSGSFFSAADTARQALAALLPALEAARRDRSLCGSGFLHIVILDPAFRSGEVPLEEAILLEHTLGDRLQWDADYAAFARAKAALAWRECLSSGAVQQQRPHALRRGDSLLAGAVWLDGIVVAVSGAFAEIDEAFALAIAAQLRALATRQRAQAQQDGACEAGLFKR